MPLREIYMYQDFRELVKHGSFLFGLLLYKTLQKDLQLDVAMPNSPS
ncbi:hypothetical protein GXM_06813 [Nostoc sphaeroides CCNUC1]|uniref:Uncharacterized protein n=1 Tax=Nostoc sphaeroides CCNUC1 TaxID=2653204 RepID=A0A5P8WBN5_9NOSO|nr:hypothetical protein GXM_06813 [Nostoc sphaeroides CCNUC1]